MNNTATHLRSTALHWSDLRDAMGQPTIVGAFGRGLRGYLAALDDAEQQEARLHEAAHLRSLERDPLQLGDRPTPVRLHVLDTMRVVEAALVACADDIAHATQRHPMTPPRAARAAVPRTRAERVAWEDRARQVEQARADLVDPRRWRYTGARTAPHAALWLLARIEYAAGPCRRITEDEERRIGKVAAGACERVERALDIAAQRRTLEQRHDECGGVIDMHGGEGRLPVAHCTGCGRVWAEGVIAA